MADHSPYADLPPSAFWRSAVRLQDPETLDDLWRPKFALTPDTALMTAGSCFAQHIHRSLTGAGWNVLQEEGMMTVLPKAVCHRWGHDLFSARYGNIYTARQFLELLREALTDAPVRAIVWEKDGRFVDALRPGVEPLGLARAEDVHRARAEHLAAVRRLLHGTDCIVFTLGLTEAWEDVATGRTLPVAPGTVAGRYDPDQVKFRNFGFSEVLEDLRAARDLLRAHGIGARFLLTVSPVPLTATASGDHVGTATAYSKAVLRAVCGELCKSDPDFDYFPSYEIITTPVLGGPFFSPDLRNPSDAGVARVLAAFTAALGASASPRGKPGAVQDDPAADVQCEEALLDAFRR